MFDAYRTRLGAAGGSNRGYISKASIMAKEDMFEDTRSFKEVFIDGKKYDARITQDVSDTVKTGGGNYTIEFRDGVFFYPGTYVQIQNMFGVYERWLICDILDDLFFTQSLIKKCNYYLKWRDSTGEITGRWICFDDSYKLYSSINRYAYNTFLPEGSIVIILPYDSEAAKLKLDTRLIIDADTFAKTPDVYKVANRNVVSRLWDNDNGIIKLSLKQSQFNPMTDNAEEMVANYYTEDDGVIVDDRIITQNDKQLKITFSGKNQIVMGTSYKEYKLCFMDSNDNELPDEVGFWQVDILPEFEDWITYEIDGNILRIQSVYNENLNNYKFRVQGFSEDETLSAEIYIKVVSGV